MRYAIMVCHWNLSLTFIPQVLSALDEDGDGKVDLQVRAGHFLSLDFLMVLLLPRLFAIGT